MGEVDNSSLTGESEPQKRDWKPSDETPAESANLTFFGTLVVNGKGTGVVIATGDETFMGRTAQLATSTDGEDTPIAKEIKDFVFKVSMIAFILGITFFIIGMVETGIDGLVQNVVFLIGIIVANVPEGLLATVTVSLTLTAKRMASSEDSPSKSPAKKEETTKEKQEKRKEKKSKKKAAMNVFQEEARPQKKKMKVEEKPVEAEAEALTPVVDESDSKTLSSKKLKKKKLKKSS